MLLRIIILVYMNRNKLTCVTTAICRSCTTQVHDKKYSYHIKYSKIWTKDVLLWYILNFVDLDSLRWNLGRRGATVSFATRTMTQPSFSTEGTKSAGAGGYGALNLEERSPLRISLKKPSPPWNQTKLQQTRYYKWAGRNWTCFFFCFFLGVLLVHCYYCILSFLY